MEILIEYDSPYECQGHKSKPATMPAQRSFWDWLLGRRTDNAEVKESKDVEVKESKAADLIKAYVTLDSPVSNEFMGAKQVKDGKLHKHNLHSIDDPQSIKDFLQMVLGTSGLVHLFAVRKSIALVTRILPERLDTIMEIVREVKNWEKDVNVVLYTSSPSPGIDTQTLTDLLKAVDLTVVCDISGLSEKAKDDAQSVISTFINVTLGGLDGIEPHSIGTISYNGIHMPDLNAEGADLRPKLDEEFAFHKPIAWLAGKSIENCRIFFSAPQKGEFRGEIEDLFVHEKRYPIQSIGNTPARVDIIRFYYVSDYDRGDVIDICLDSFDKSMGVTDKRWATS